MNRRRKSRPETPATCPVCGEDVPPGAPACPECGADHNSGWREGADTYDGASLPGEDFDYDGFVREEFGAGPRPRGVKTIWWITAIILAAVLAGLYLSL